MILFFYMNYSTVIGMRGLIINCSKEINFSLTCCCFLPLLQKNADVLYIMLCLFIAYILNYSFLETSISLTGIIIKKTNNNKPQKTHQISKNFHFTQTRLKKKPLT